jgi:hypothetical protein
VQWTVNSTTGDCDLYVRHEQIPTRNAYDQNDVGVEKSFSLKVVNGESRKWYAGVHGFSNCRFAIEVTLTGGNGGECPNACSGHGMCAMDRCQCHDGWAGLDCSTPVEKVSLGRVVSNTVGQMAWKYYVVNLASPHSVSVQLNETRLGGDADLFIKFGALPNNTYFDYRDVTTEPSVKLDVMPPTRTFVMYVGVYGFASTSYSLLIAQESECPSQCSRHGQCSGTSCRCSFQFSGSICETMNQPLPNGQAMEGYVADGVWNYYHFVSNSLTSVVIQVDQDDSDPTADCDVYVRAGGLPTQTLFDFADVTYNRQMTITIPQPQFNTWYIGIYGSRKCAYQVQQAISSSCIEGCNPPFGTCTGENTCHCFSGWAGNNCRIPVAALGVGQTVEGTLSANQFTYYAFNVTSSIATVSLLEVEPWSTGYYWLFVGVEMVPDQENFDYSNTETNTPYHQVDLELGAVPNDPITVYIGVYGSPFDLAGPNHPPAHFKLSAWQSPF